MSDPMLANFILDYFRLMIGGSMNSHEIEALMDEEIETCEEELEVPAHSLNTVGGCVSGVRYCGGGDGGG